MGMAALDKKFEVTAMTHRKDRPIYISHLPPSYEAENIVHPMTEACFYKLASSMFRDLVLDVNILHGFRQLGGIVIQVRKTTSWSEGMVRNILSTALSVPRYAIAVAVDEDVDIYNADEVLWAIWTRGNREDAVWRGAKDSLIPGVLGAVPTTAAAFERGGLSEGGLAIDATLPLEIRGRYKRARYHVDRVDLKNWFSEEDLKIARQLQSEYARSLAKSGG
jgi:3-polyprenyl-4-hydroxybenzoate decarboxylase